MQKMYHGSKSHLICNIAIVINFIKFIYFTIGNETVYSKNRLSVETFLLELLCIQSIEKKNICKYPILTNVVINWEPNNSIMCFDTFFCSQKVLRTRWYIMFYLFNFFYRYTISLTTHPSFTFAL